MEPCIRATQIFIMGIIRSASYENLTQLVNGENILPVSCNPIQITGMSSVNTDSVLPLHYVQPTAPLEEVVVKKD
jgi:hypothetical protein